MAEKALTEEDDLVLSEVPDSEEIDKILAAAYASRDEELDTLVYTGDDDIGLGGVYPSMWIGAGLGGVAGGLGMQAHRLYKATKLLTGRTPTRAVTKKLYDAAISKTELGLTGPGRLHGAPVGKRKGTFGKYDALTAWLKGIISKDVDVIASKAMGTRGPMSPIGGALGVDKLAYRISESEMKTVLRAAAKKLYGVGTDATIRKLKKKLEKEIGATSTRPHDISTSDKLRTYLSAMLKGGGPVGKYSGRPADTAIREGMEVLGKEVFGGSRARAIGLGATAGALGGAYFGGADTAFGSEVDTFDELSAPIEKLKKEYPELAGMFGGIVAPVASSEFTKIAHEPRYGSTLTPVELAEITATMVPKVDTFEAHPDVKMDRWATEGIPSPDTPIRDYDPRTGTTIISPTPTADVPPIDKIGFFETPLEAISEVDTFDELKTAFDEEAAEKLILDMGFGAGGRPAEVDPDTGETITWSMIEGRMTGPSGGAYETKFAADRRASEEETARLEAEELAKYGPGGYYASDEYRKSESDRIAAMETARLSAAEAEEARLARGARWTEEAPWTFEKGLETLPPWASTRDIYTVPDVKVWGTGRMVSDVLAGSLAGHSWVAPSGRVMTDKLTPAEASAATLSMEDYLPKSEAIYFPTSLMSSVTGEPAGEVYSRWREAKGESPSREWSEYIYPTKIPELREDSGTLRSEYIAPSTHPDIGWYAGWLPSTRERFDVDAGITYEDIVRDRADPDYLGTLLAESPLGWRTPYRGEEITSESFAALIPAPAMGEFE